MEEHLVYILYWTQKQYLNTGAVGVLLKFNEESLVRKWYSERCF